MNKKRERIKQKGDADLGQWDPCAMAAVDKFTGLQKSCGEKGTARPLSK